MRCAKMTISAASSLVVLIVLMCSGVVFAVPALPATRMLFQFDGSIVSARQWGDESLHGWETVDGYSIVFDETLNSWAYAEQGPDGSLQSSSVVARSGDAAPVGAMKGMRPSAGYRQTLSVGKKRLSRESFDSQAPRIGALVSAPQAYSSQPITGTANLPVFLVNFSNTTATYQPADFDSLLFGTNNFSMRDYYEEVSQGAFHVVGPVGVAGWYTAANTHDYYGTNDRYGYDKWPGTLVREAVSAADSAGFDFSIYDRDGDCYVDVVNIVHQGTGEETGVNNKDIWSHRWTLQEAYASGYGDGGEYVTSSICPADPSQFMKVNDYLIVPEILWSGILQTVGVFVHEYGHSLGLPDLYDTDSSSVGAGCWSIMASGSWSMVTTDGDRPSHMDAWSKAFLGWLIPVQVSGTLTDQPISTVSSSVQGSIYQLLDGTALSGEHFLVENRQQTGFDAGLPGGGLLLWHIDGALIARTMSANSVNDTECRNQSNCSVKHYGVGPIQADNRWDLEMNRNEGDATDLYGSTNKTFNAISRPSSSLFSGGTSSVSITSISDPATVMYATLSAPVIKHTTALVISAPAVTYGEDAIITVTVSSSTGMPSGTVTLSVAGGAVIEQVLSAVSGTASSATFSLTKPNAGDYSLSASYAEQGSYTASAASGMATINKRPLIVTAIGGSKTYDGTRTASVSLSDDRLSGDGVTATYTSATFDTKAVGINKTVYVTGITISGASANNYALVSSSTTALASITPQAFVIAAHGVDKMYDRTTAATITLSDNRVAGDSVTVSYAAAAFTDKAVGNGKTVNVSGITCVGADAPNYSLADTTVVATASIIPPDGDLDGNGVGVSDALRTLQLSVGLIAPTATDISHADVAPLVNGTPQPDDAIDIGDVVVILRKALEIVTW